jgi:hypothetical protein
MTNGGLIKQSENPIDLVSPGDFPAIADVYGAHGRATDDGSSFMGALDEYFAEHGQTRTPGGNYRPMMRQDTDGVSLVSRYGTPAAIALEYATLCKVLRQLYRAKQNASSPSKVNSLESKLRGIEQKLGYGNLEQQGHYLAELLYFDAPLEQFLQNGGGQTTSTPRDIVEYRQGMKEAEDQLATAASTLQDAIFASWEKHDTAKTAFEANLRSQGISPGNFDLEAWVPGYAVTNALGLYPFERQVDIIDRMTASLEKHAHGSVILLEMLRTGVPFDPLALFDVAINKGQQMQFFVAPRPLVERDGSWEFTTWEKAGDDPTVWSRVGTIIQDPVADGASSAVSKTYPVAQTQYSVTGIQKKYRIDATTDLGARLAAIASRFLSAVTSTLRGYQDRESLDSDEEKRVEELAGYLAVIGGAFIDPANVNSNLPGNQRIEHLGGKIPKTAAGRSNASPTARRARLKYKENMQVQQTLPTMQKTLTAVSQIQGYIGSIAGAQLETLKSEIKRDVQADRISLPDDQSMEEYIERNGDWRTHHNDLIDVNRRFTHMSALFSSLQVGFSIIDHARFNQDYQTGEFIGQTTSFFATAGGAAADIDSIIANKYSAYDEDLFIQRGLGEVAGKVADAVDVALTIKSGSVNTFNSVAIGNGWQAVETSTTALVSIGSVAAGYAIGGPVGAVIGAILDIVATWIVDALFDDLSDLEEWASATVFGTELDEKSTAWGPWDSINPVTASPSVEYETESDTGEGFTYFQWNQSAIRRVVGYYNLTMGFDVDTYEYGPVLSRASDPDLEMKLVLKDISFGQTDSTIALCPVRWINDRACVVDPPYMALELSAGQQQVTVNPNGMYGLSTDSVFFDCETNGSVQSPAPTGEWVHDVFAFDAYHKYTGSGRPVTWPPANPPDVRGELWGFEIVHLLPTLPGQAASTLDQHFSYSQEDARASIENVPHPRGWIQPDGLWEFPP